MAVQKTTNSGLHDNCKALGCIMKKKWNISMTKGHKISKKKCCPGFFQKTNTGAILCLKIAPAFVFWKNPGRHNLLLRFTDRQQKLNFPTLLAKDGFNV